MKELDRILSKYKVNDKVLGILLVGSNAREYRDSLSDYDLEVIVEDAYYKTLPPEKRLYTYSNESIVCEFLIYPKSDFLSKINSKADIDHWPYEECKIIYDPKNFLFNTIPFIVMMKSSIRDSRIELHYFEFLFSANRIKKLIQRGDELNLRLTVCQLALALVRLLFILNNRWPPAIHWVSQNMYNLHEIPDGINDILLEILKNPTEILANELINRVDKILRDKNYLYAYIKSNLSREVCTYEFRCIREDYGIL